MEGNEHPHSLEDIEHYAEADVSWESDAHFDPLMVTHFDSPMDNQFDPLMDTQFDSHVDNQFDSYVDTQIDPLEDHLSYTRHPSEEPQHFMSNHLQPHYYQQQATHNSTPWYYTLRPPHSFRRQSFNAQRSSYPGTRPTPRLREMPKSAIAQRILKEEAAARQKQLENAMPPLTPIKSPIETENIDANGKGVGAEEEEYEMVEDESHSIDVSPPPMEQEQSNDPRKVDPVVPIPQSPPSVEEQAIISRELNRLLPSIDELAVLPVNSHAIVCDKATVMVQRVHQFMRRISESLGNVASDTPFAYPDQLTGAILGLSWRSVKRAVEKPPVDPGPLPSCRTQHRPPVRQNNTENKRGEIPVETRVAIVKDYMVNRRTQSSCATKYGVKLSYVQYVVKRFRQTGVLHVGDTEVNQDELPRESNGAIRESALIRRLNEMADPPIMGEKTKDMEKRNRQEWQCRRGRKRKRYPSEEIGDTSKTNSISVWSDIDEEEKIESPTTKVVVKKEAVSDESIDTETSGTVDQLQEVEEPGNVINPKDLDGGNVNIIDTSSDDGDMHIDSN